MQPSVSHQEPADGLASIYSPIARIWEPGLYDVPDAMPSQLAIQLAGELATQLLTTQVLYVTDHRAGVISYVSEGAQRLLGYSAEEYAAWQYDIIHPDDRPIVLEATLLVNQYLVEHRHEPLEDVLFSIDLRVRHKQGHYLRVLRRNVLLVREPHGALVATAGILTDISHHKYTPDIRFHFNRPDFPAFVQQRQLRALPVALGRRERQVLALVLEGLSSGQIAEHLGIHLATVVTHRRNIKCKVGSHDLFRLLRHLDVDNAG